jgi:hypothetical protein
MVPAGHAVWRTQLGPEGAVHWLWSGAHVPPLRHCPAFGPQGMRPPPAGGSHRREGPSYRRRAVQFRSLEPGNAAGQALAAAGRHRKGAWAPSHRGASHGRAARRGAARRSPGRHSQPSASTPQTLPAEQAALGMQEPDLQAPVLSSQNWPALQVPQNRMTAGPGPGGTGGRARGTLLWGGRRIRAKGQAISACPLGPHHFALASLPSPTPLEPWANPPFPLNLPTPPPTSGLDDDSTLAVLARGDDGAVDTPAVVRARGAPLALAPPLLFLGPPLGFEAHAVALLAARFARRRGLSDEARGALGTAAVRAGSKARGAHCGAGRPGG